MHMAWEDHRHVEKTRGRLGLFLLVGNELLTQTLGSIAIATCGLALPRLVELPRKMLMQPQFSILIGLAQFLHIHNSTLFLA